MKSINKLIEKNKTQENTIRVIETLSPDERYSLNTGFQMPPLNPNSNKNSSNQKSYKNQLKFLHKKYKELHQQLAASHK